MTALDRRDVLKGALVGATAVARASASAAEGESPGSDRPFDIVDVNISLFQWPFRRLPYDAIEQLVTKLRSLGINQAWAGSYEGLLHRDVRGVNRRLADVCRTEGKGLFLPFGSVNPMLPDWEEDLRRCHELHGMPGIRLHPNYHGYSLDSPRFARLLSLAAERKLLVQLAAAMEDTRTQHPLVRVPDVDLTPLPELMRKVAAAELVLLNWRPKGEVLDRLADLPGIFFDIARVEGTSGIEQLAGKVGPDRVLLGTHAPFLVPEAALIKIYESQLTEAESRAIRHESATRLLS